MCWIDSGELTSTPKPFHLPVMAARSLLQLSPNLLDSAALGGARWSVFQGRPTTTTSRHPPARDQSRRRAYLTPALELRDLTLLLAVPGLNVLEAPTMKAPCDSAKETSTSCPNVDRHPRNLKAPLHIPPTRQTRQVVPGQCWRLDGAGGAAVQTQTVPR